MKRQKRKGIKALKPLVQILIIIGALVFPGRALIIRFQYRAVKDPSNLQFESIQTACRISSLAMLNDNVLIGTESRLFSVSKKELFKDEELHLKFVSLGSLPGKVTGIYVKKGKAIVRTAEQVLDVDKNFKVSEGANFSMPGNTVKFSNSRYIVSNLSLCMQVDASNIKYIYTAGFPVQCIAGFKNDLYFGTLGGGLRFLQKKHAAVPGSPKIVNALLAVDDVLLIGSESGLFIYKDIQAYRVSIAGPVNNNISAMVYYKKKLYIGTFSHGLSWYDGEWNHIQFTNHFKANLINAMVGYDKKIWVASDNGIYSISAKKGEVEFNKQIKKHAGCVGIVNGRLATGSKGTLHYYGATNWQETKATNCSIISLAEFSNRIWIGGSRGLFKFDGKKTELLSPINNTCFARWIQAFAQSPEGLYVGSYDRGFGIYTDRSNW